ncbi:carotenoid biosynthesis protein [Robiginitalea aurantiaca]|uniref:Carotenoid biosynthesis protein n=1 Tax=Robiginitalea aurantiaca TaxID=3056915 RepID=A0ABT7WCV6_9FLAO|nr:carotenoid biosynthesis protein [Robiginitalea aurantiaca]MDM9630728.1 carotenoid biosynthesis protein [Robiginitalea aurantiaca]
MTHSTSISERYKLPLGIFLIWLLHLSGLIGILSGHSEWFVTKTPLNLLLMTLLFIWIFPLNTRRKVLLFAFICASGIAAEWIGVHTGLLFGSYHYGGNLGPKLDGIPYLIGINWALLSFCSGCVSSDLPLPKGARILFGSLLLVGLDFFMEGMAPRLDFWTFEGGTPPLWNYTCWFILSVLFLWGYEKIGIKGDRLFSIHLLSAQFVFFIGLYLLS